MKFLFYVSTVLLLQQTGAQLSSIFGGNKCDQATRKLSQNNQICALLFDDDGCNGWEQVVGEGYLKLDFRKRNDAEAVVVKPGCVLIGYDEEKGESGESYTFDASSRSSPLIIKNLDNDQLDEDIEAVDCYCGTNGRRVVQPITSSATVQDAGIINTFLGNDRVTKCNEHIAIFNRPGPDQICAILFDEGTCDGDMQAVTEGYTKLDNDMDDDAESVMVRPGCVLVGYDRGRLNPFGQGDSVTIDATNGNGQEPLVKNLNGNADLREDISAVECNCQPIRHRNSDRGQRPAGLAGREGSGNAGNKRECQNAFTSGASADCILYDDEDCQVEKWSAPVSLTRGQSRAFKFEITSPIESLKYRNTVESVSVRAGCRLEVFDDSSFGSDDKGSDDSYVFVAPTTSNLHVTLDESSNSIVRVLDDDINSVRCFCN